LVDVVISDPPFDNHVSSKAKPRISYLSKKRRLREGVKGGANGLSFDGIDPSAVGPVLVAAARRWVVIFCAVEQIGQFASMGRRGEGGPFVRGGWWAKTNVSPQFSADRPGSPGEGIAVLHRCGGGRMRWNGGGHKAEWRGPGIVSDHSARGLHETQKPLWIMLELVRLFSEPGELVWDPYCGSGTTGVACLRLGRRFLGHDMQPHYAEVAAERMAAEERGLTLRDARAGQTSIFDVEGVGQ
jgi:site-specific DNA-methyltransferase (adenine-specific)